jgi:hypothetical protein
MHLTILYRITTIVFLSAVWVQGQGVFDQYEKEMVLKNRIKNKTHWISGSLANKGYKSMEVFYDQKGLVVEETTFRSSGVIAIKKNYKYDNLGNTIEYQTYDGQRDKITFKKMVKYQGGNKLIENGFDGVDRFENRYTYDASGNLQEIRYYVSDKLIERREVKYADNKKEIIVYNANNQVIERHINFLDAKGNMLENITISSAGKESNKVVYTYGQQGNKTSETTYFSGQLKNKKYYEYVNGRLVKAHLEEPGNARFVEKEYIYDSKGRITMERWSNDGGKNYSSKAYIYNNQGNVIEINSYFAAYNFSEDVKISYAFY